jgi:hypothetical protein
MSGCQTAFRCMDSAGVIDASQVPAWRRGMNRSIIDQCRHGIALGSAHEGGIKVLSYLSIAEPSRVGASFWHGRFPECFAPPSGSPGSGASHGVVFQP